MKNKNFIIVVIGRIISLFGMLGKLNYGNIMSFIKIVDTVGRFV